MRFHLFKWSCLILFASGLCTASAAPVSKGRATELATGWLSEGTARLGKKMHQTVQAEIVYRDKDGDVSFYAIQLEPQGFMIVSADDVIEPVIAFSDSGATDDLVDGSPLLAMLNIDLPERNKHARTIESAYAASQQQFVGSGKQSRRPEHAQANKDKWEKYAGSAKHAAHKSAATTSASPTDLAAADVESLSYGGLSSVSDMRIAPIIQSKWSQKTAQGVVCYNYYCPPGPNGNANNYYAGCIATSMAQLMRYWQYPVSGIGQITKSITVDAVTQSATTRGGNDSGGPYGWSGMPLNPALGTLTLAQRQAIGRLLADCGTAVNMQYSSGESSAYFSVARSAIVSVFGYSNAKYTYAVSGLSALLRDSILRSNLAAGYPVLTGIRNTSNNAGHAVITDGFGYSSAALYFHVNYGWGGSSDAWYNMPTMDSSPSYNMVDLLVYNIYSTGTGEIIAGRIIDPNGVALQGVIITAVSGSVTNSATTDAGGYYGIRVPGGYTYAMAATKPGFISGSLTGVVVGASANYSAPNANVWGADLCITSDPAQSIPTLGEWGMIILAVCLLLAGAQVISRQGVANANQTA